MLILASSSKTRIDLLKNAGIEFQAIAPNVDEMSVKESLLAEGTSPRDIADALAELKALKISRKYSQNLTLGSDQILELEHQIVSKAESKEELLDNLQKLNGRKHKLFSSAVVALDGQPIWRFIGEAQIQLKNLSDEFLKDYVDRNFDEIRYSVGGYQIENEGVQLIEDYRGDYFTILGLPVIQIVSFLQQRGELPA